jgi:hypothetical protein
MTMRYPSIERQIEEIGDRLRLAAMPPAPTSKAAKSADFGIGLAREVVDNFHGWHEKAKLAAREAQGTAAFPKARAELVEAAVAFDAAKKSHADKVAAAHHVSPPDPKVIYRQLLAPLADARREIAACLALVDLLLDGVDAARRTLPGHVPAGNLTASVAVRGLIRQARAVTGSMTVPTT